MSGPEFRIISYYLTAKRAVLDAGFGYELVWQASRRPGSIDESEFLAEAAWVIMSAGLSERAVHASFDGVAASFLDFRSAQDIVQERAACCTNAMRHFRHPGKIDAIATCAQMVFEDGYSSFLQRVASDPLEVLDTIPYIGAVTARHLAKSIGFPVCKPDRHLVRTAKALGHSVESMCETIGLAVGDAVQVVDVVLWRYAVIRGLKRDRSYA